MKLRIKGNSIRLRLLKSEVDRFAADGKITEETSFGSGELRYSLFISSDAEKIYADFEDNEIKLFIPESSAREWAINDQVGFESQQPVGDNKLLTLLIEKDFACLDRPDDPDLDDAFPNPNTTC